MLEGSLYEEVFYSENLGSDVIFDLVNPFETHASRSHTTHAPTFLPLCILSLKCIHVANHPSLSSFYLAQYPVLLRRDELLDENRSGSNIPLLRTLFYSDRSNRPH